MSGENFGRDLVGVQNLIKKHSRLGSELSSHQPRLEVLTHAHPKFIHLSKAIVSYNTHPTRWFWQEVENWGR